MLTLPVFKVIITIIFCCTTIYKYLDYVFTSRVFNRQGQPGNFLIPVVLSLLYGDKFPVWK
jgi:hypothetical protein